MTRAAQYLRFGRFNLVGLLGAALQLILLYLLMKCFRLSGVAATPVAVEITALHNFVWHERFTWCDRRLNSLPQTVIRLCRFQAGNGLVSLAGNTVLMYALVERLKVPAAPSAISAIVICSLANFLIADRWVYANRPARNEGKFGTATGEPPLR